LSATSPAVDGGASRTDLPTDITGRLRPQGAGFDIGAYELESSAGPCQGDCDEDGRVLVNELIIGVRILLETAELAACPAMDGDEDGAVAVNELVGGVLSALAGCGGDAAIATDERVSGR
jgi:hypothetical protein